MSTNSKGITTYQKKKPNGSSISGEQSQAKAAYARHLAILQFLANNDWLKHKNHLEIQNDCQQAIKMINVAYPKIVAEISQQDIHDATLAFANDLNAISMEALQQYHKIYEEYFALADKKCPDSLERQHELYANLRKLEEKYPEIRYRLLLDQATGTFKPINTSEQSISSCATKKSTLTSFFENNNRRNSSKGEKPLSTTTNNDTNSNSFENFFIFAPEFKKGLRNIAPSSVVQYQDDPYTHNYSLKILIIGDASVGKTSLIKRFSEDTYAESTSLGEMSKPEKIIIILEDKSSIQFQVQEPSKLGPRGPIPFGSIKPNYIIIAFDVTNRESFKNVVNWLKEIEYYAHRDSIVTLAATKCDVPEAEWEVSREEIKALAESLGKNVFFTSAKEDDDHNVDQLFLGIADSVIQNAPACPANRI